MLRFDEDEELKLGYLSNSKLINFKHKIINEISDLNKDQLLKL